MNAKTFSAPKNKKAKTKGLLKPRFVPGLGDLIDRLSVDQLKEAFHASMRTSIRSEIADLEHDIDEWAELSQIKLSGRNVRTIIVLAQINYEIWMCKERMEAEAQHYDKWLRRAHQLNGIRNKMKNLLLQNNSNGSRLCEASNVSVDQLKDWNIQL